MFRRRGFCFGGVDGNKPGSLVLGGAVPRGVGEPRMLTGMAEIFLAAKKVALVWGPADAVWVVMDGYAKAFAPEVGPLHETKNTT